MKLFVDTETTGVNPHRDDIIQFCGILTGDDYQPVKLVNMKFDSPKIGPFILDLLGLTLRDFQTEFTAKFGDHVKDIYEVLLEGDMTVYAYNASFDLNMIKRNMERAGMPVPQLDKVEVMRPKRKLEVAMEESGYKSEDVLKYADMLFPGTRGYHDATYDTVCALLLARDMKL